MKNGILTTVFLLGLAFSVAGCTRRSSIANIGKALTDCGISGVTDEFIAGFEKENADIPDEVVMNQAAAMLFSLGFGNWDFKTMEWTPSHNGVYSCSTEMPDVIGGYKSYLLGLKDIGNGELEFTDISMDDSNVDWENGNGILEISFLFNGKPYIETARVQYDWFDTDFAERIRRIVGENNGKKLWFTTDGYGALIVFYRDPMWAQQFEKKTGLKLHDSME